MNCENIIFRDKQIIFELSSSRREAVCPFCGYHTRRAHSSYVREIQDIPIQDKQVILLLKTRKMFCENPKCEHKTFSEQFEFVVPKGKKTKRLTDKIVITATKLSSVNASKLLKADAITVGKSSICNLLKKNACHCG